MFWLNAFSNSPQVAGCCEQSIALPVTQVMRYTLGTDDHAADRAFEVSLAWLQALGANYVVVPGPESTDVYKREWAHPGKFAGRLEEMTREGGNIIYAVPQRSVVPAHLVLLHELVSRVPENGLDIGALAEYIAAIEDPMRPPVEARNLDVAPDPRVLDFKAQVPEAYLISVQIPYHAGWHATVNGRPVPVRQDALGLIVLEPDVAGPAAIRLSFEHWPEQRICRAISYVTLFSLLAAWLFPLSLRKTQNFSKPKSL
jgi:hypothetical protein